MVVKDLNRWFKEKWVDVSRKDKDGKHPPCGRKKAKKGSKGYPKCRPSVKVSSKTPKTSGSMTEGQKRAATKRKRSKKQGVGGKPTIVKSLVLKRPVSPEAKRHKLEYDTKYESTPERVKYREELKRERRHRGIEGKGGPDMSHTKNHTLVAEDPHTNRARHFKERGTLKGDPMGIAWLLLKFDLDQRSPDDMDEFERLEEDLMRQFNRQRTPEQTLSRGQLRRLEQSRPARGQPTKNFAANPEAVERASEKLRATRAAQNQEMARRKLEESIDAAEIHPGRQGTSNFSEVRDLFQTMHPTRGDIYNSRTYGTPPLEALKDPRMKDAHVKFEFNSRDAQRAKTAGEFDKRQDLATLFGAMGLIAPEAGIYHNPPDTGSETLDVKELLRQLYEVPRVHTAFPPRVQIGGVSNPPGPYPTFQGLPFRTEEDSMFGVPFTTGEPMDLSFRLLKGEW
jgi:hypothetical protein